MKNLSLKNYLALALVYIVIQAIGMAVMYYGLGAFYGTADFVIPTLITEIILAALIVFFVTRYSSWKEVGYGKLSWLNFLWIIPLLITAGIPTINYLIGLAQPGVDSSALVGLLSLALLTLIVGFCEETMFRGIALRGPLLKHGVIVSILISSALFALLHVINVFGGFQPDSMLRYLFNQAMFGLLMALLALKIRNLIPLILFHAMWDFISLAGLYVQPAYQSTLLSMFDIAQLVLQFGLTVILVLVILFDRNRERLAQPLTE